MRVAGRGAALGRRGAFASVRAAERRCVGFGSGPVRSAGGRSAARGELRG